MSVVIRDFKANLTDERIAEVESCLEIIFPTDYKQFLLQHNGGYPEPGTFTIGHGPEESQISYFFSIQEDETSNLLEMIKLTKGQIPRNMLPVAYDDVGNLILLGVSGDQTGQVYFWDHEQENGNDRNNGKASLSFLADSFKSFLESLY